MSTETSEADDLIEQVKTEQVATRDAALLQVARQVYQAEEEAARQRDRLEKLTDALWYVRYSPNYEQKVVDFELEAGVVTIAPKETK